MNVPLLYFEDTGIVPQQLGLAHPSIRPYGAFETSDGAQVLISIQNEREWASFCAVALEEPDLATAGRKLDEVRGYPTEFVQALTQSGYLSALIPEEYGGAGLPLSAAAAILEEAQR